MQTDSNQKTPGQDDVDEPCRQHSGIAQINPPDSASPALHICQAARTLIVTSDIIPQTVGEETAEVCHYILDLRILFIARTVRGSYLKINLNSRKNQFYFC